MEPAPVSTDALVSPLCPLHREASEHGGKWHPGRGTKTEILTGKEECWELTEGVVSSIVEGGSGIGRVRTQQQVSWLTRWQRVKSEKWSLFSDNGLDCSLFVNRKKKRMTCPTIRVALGHFRGFPVKNLNGQG